MTQTPPDHDEHVRELFRRAGAEPLALGPSGSARRHAEQARTRRRTGAAAVAVAAVVGATAFVTVPRGGEGLPPSQTPFPTVTSSAPAPSTDPAPTTTAPSSTEPVTPPPTLPAGLPLLPLTRDDLVVGRSITEQVDASQFALRECGLPGGHDGGAPYPADALDTHQWLAEAGESWLYEDVVVLPDEAAADDALDALRHRYGGCLAPPGGQAQSTFTTEVRDVGDEAILVTVELPDDLSPQSYSSVVVRQGTTLAMYTLLRPLPGDESFEDSFVRGLVDEFVAAASAQ